MISHRIAIITDLHIDDKEKMKFDIDTKSNLLLLLDDIKKQRIHHLIITGDLCNTDPKIYIYKWIKKQLEIYDFTYNIIPGNHDDPLMIKEVFGINNPYFSLDEWGRKVLFLNTSDNTLPKTQLSWIKEQLIECKKDVLIFMHHPPLLIGCKLMDTKFPLQNIEETQELFLSIKNKLTIFCGHYHTQKDITYKNQHIIVTPSNIFQIDCDVEDFRIETYNPSWRFLEMNKNDLVTNVTTINIGREK